MSKFRIRLKVTGFELEIEGNREDAAIIGKNIGEQMASMIAPGLNVVEGEVAMDRTATQNLPLIGTPPKKNKKPASRNQSVTSNKEEQPLVQFRNDAGKYGTPTQKWNTLEKALWFLYVADKEANSNELSASQIGQSFNAMFKQAKKISPSNVSRDLGRAKVANPSLVGDDSTATPAKWFLTEEGIKIAQKLISDSLSPSVG
jgi:hypothetical protein